MWVGARLLCGALAFFFVSFVFAYFYLRSLDTNHDWKIGHGQPVGRARRRDRCRAAAQRGGAARRRDAARAHGRAAGVAALVLALLSVVLQVIEWTTLGFGPASGGYASVFIGWTAFYAVFTLVVRLLDRDPGGDRLAAAARGRPATPAEVLTDTRGLRPGSRRARSSGRSTSRSACCCS